MKSIKYVFLVVGGIVLFIAIAAIVLSLSTKISRNHQDDYFSNASYLIKGKMKECQFLGGVSYLMEIDLDSISINDNDLSDNDFVGLYDSKSNKVFAVLGFEKYKEDVINKMRPYIVLDSKTRTVLFIKGDEIYTEKLMPADVYKYKLKNIERKNMTRF